MPWKPLPFVAFAIVTYPFNASHPNDLPLQIGDHIYIIEQGGNNNEWYRGYLVAPASLLAGLSGDRGQQLEHRVFSGIFPSNCVEVRELLGEDKADTKKGNDVDTATSQTDPDGQDEVAAEARARRRSQRVPSSRASRALSRKRSIKSMERQSRVALIDPNMPMPRNPKGPKPLAPLPLLRVGDETGQSAEEPLVDEIASCLREWHDARVHQVVLARGYDQLSRVQKLVQKVDISRKQLMHDVMTMKELNSLREDTVWDLVTGNKLLNDEVVVRSPTQRGRILTADDSIIEMTKLQANMSILDRPPKGPVDSHILYHILVDVRTLVCESEVPATLQVYLCLKDDQQKLQPLTENYAIPVPLPSVSASTPEDQPKTLFVNLSASDVGSGSPSSSLYLVFKLVREEPTRTTPIYSKSQFHANGVASNTNGPQAKNFVRTSGGRRSMFGSQRKSHETGHGRGASRTERPDTAHSTSESRTGASNPDAPSSHEAKMVKRTVGIAVIDIGAFARAESQFEKRVTFWAPAPVVEPDNSHGGDGWDDVIRDLWRNAPGYQKLNSVRRFDVFAKSFASPELDTLIRVTPTFLHEVHLSQKIGFSSAPTQKRSDIYLTLSEAAISRLSSVSHAKFGQTPLSQVCHTSMANLQLTLEVRKQDGERIEECIFTSSNRSGHTAWRTTAVEIGEFWNQTIRLAIKPEDVPGSHIVMSIADSPDFPFALAWVPLWEGDAFVRDGEHSAALYVYDEYSSSMIGGKGAYLALPPWQKKADPSLASIKLMTYLCSTQYSQDPTLLGLLNWRSTHGKRLVGLLERFNFVPEIEILKLLEDVFRSLFEILDAYSESEQHATLVFNNFIHVLTITRDKWYGLDSAIEHAKTRFQWPNASEALIRAWNRLLKSPLDPDASSQLRATLKVGDSMLHLILETRKERSEDGTIVLREERRENLIEDLQKMFVALMALMRNPMSVLLSTQTLVVQYFHTWLSELAEVMEPKEVLEVATDLLDACGHAQGQMILYRLVLIINYSSVPVLKQPQVRSAFVANIFRWLAPYWGAVVDEATEQWRDQVRLCCSVVAAQLTEMGEDTCQYIPKLVESYTILQAAPKRKKSRFSMLFPNTYPFPLKRTPEEVEIDEAMLEISALLAAALTSESRLYFDASVVDVSGLLLQALNVGQSVLNCEAFPSSWVSLLVSHHRLSIRALERISEILVDSLPDIFSPDAEQAFEFDTVMWRAFFNTLFLAVSSPSLAMETFPEQKRRAIWKIAGDVREMGAQLLKKNWEAIGWETDEDSKKLHGFDRMGGYQVQFVPELIAPVVELCLSVHASLRNVGIQVLRSMIVSSWEIDQDLNVIQTAMIECLDTMCRTKKDITERVLQKAFVEELLDQFAPLRHSVEDSLYNAVVEMFCRIEELLAMLARVHSEMPTSSSKGEAARDAAKIVETLRLMDFLKGVQSDDAYIRYVHKLAGMQSSAGFHTEAALALQLHATRYAWDASLQLPEMKEPDLPAQSAFERREALYFTMIGHFERGQAWKKTLDTYRELAAQYEGNIFDFAKLARTQRAMAGILERISRGDMHVPRYFRVYYRGLGFPTALRDKEFIFEGLPNDRLVTFEERMLEIHPAAHLLRGGKEASEMEGQYLQVFSVSIHKDLDHLVFQRTKVSQVTRDYLLQSTPNKFTITTRQLVHDVPITEQQVEKTIITTAEAFPNILRRSEIVHTEVTLRTPIEAAVERTTRKTQELFALQKSVRRGQDSAMGELSEALLLSVDPDSDSSVARYRSLLPRHESEDDESAEADFEQLDEGGTITRETLTPIQNALKVALMDHAIAIRGCLTLYRRSEHLATKAQLVPRFEATFARELSILFSGKVDVSEDLDMNQNDWEDRDIDPERRARSKTRDTAGHRDSAIADGDASVPASSKRRPSRRRSMNLFKRGSPHASADGVNESAEMGGSWGSRVRGSSMTRRLSLFRRGSEEEKETEKRQRSFSMSRKPSEDELRGRPETPNAALALKSRLSFLNSRAAD